MKSHQYFIASGLFGVIHKPSCVTTSEESTNIIMRLHPDGSMVLEHLFPEDWLEKRLRYAFLLAAVYTSVSILLARLLFARNSGIVSVIFAALFIMPYLDKLFRNEEQREAKELKFTVRELWIDNRETLKVYMALFCGIYLTYTAYAFLMALSGMPVVTVFGEQLAPEVGGLHGGAASMGELFLRIATNNWWVLFACFLLALIAGNASIFFIVWNASAWGTIFGFRAVEAAIHGGAFGPWVNLFIILIITLPHVFLEGLAYIIAAVSGGIMSEDIVQHRQVITNFLYYLIAVALVYVVVHKVFDLLVDFNEFPSMLLVLSVIDIAIVIVALHYLEGIFHDPRAREVFRYNYALFVFAVLLFIFAVSVEVVVLNQSTLLHRVYMAAAGLA